MIDVATFPQFAILNMSAAIKPMINKKLSMINEIVLSKDGNSNIYCGATAVRFCCAGDLKLPTITRLSNDEKFHCFEVVGNEVIHRAGQSTIEGAKHYCTSDNHFVAYHAEDSI